MFNLGTIYTTLKIFDEMSPQLKTAGYQLANFGQGLTQTGVLLSGFSLAIITAGQEIVTAGKDFEYTTAKLVALAGVTKDELDGVRQKLLDMAPAVGIGPGKLAEAMYTVSSTMSDTKVALEVLDTAVKGAAVGMGSAKDVAGALVAIINSYGKENITAARAGDILTRTIRDGGAEAHELAPRLAKVVPFANQLGVSFEEVGANLATMTKLGVPASQAVTSLASIFAALARAVPRGQRALAEVGMTYAGLRAEIKEKGLTAALIRLRETFKDNEEGLIDVVGRLEALKNVLGTTGPMAETYRQVLEEVNKSHGELDDSFETIAKTQKFMWDQLMASVEKLWIELSSALIPVMKGVIDGLRSMMPYLSQLAAVFNAVPMPIKLVAVAFLAIVAAAGPLLIYFGMLAMSIGYLTRGSALFHKEMVKAGAAAVATGNSAAVAAPKIVAMNTAFASTGVQLRNAQSGLMSYSASQTALANGAIAASAHNARAMKTIMTATGMTFESVGVRLKTAKGQLMSYAASQATWMNGAIPANAHNMKVMASMHAATVQAAYASTGLGAVMTKVTGIARTAGVALLGFGKALLLSPITWVIAGIYALSAAYSWLTKSVTVNSEEIRKSSEETRKSSEEGLKNLKVLEDLQTQLQRNIAESTDMEGISRKLLQIAPQYTGLLGLQALSYVKLTEAIDATTEAKRRDLRVQLDILEISQKEAQETYSKMITQKARLASILESGDAGRAEDPFAPVYIDTLANVRKEYTKLTTESLLLEQTMNDNRVTIEAMKEALDETYRATREAVRATDLYEAALRKMGTGDFEEGMKAAELTQKDLTEAKKDTTKMTEFLRQVELGLADAQEKGIALTKEQEAALKAYNKELDDLRGKTTAADIEKMVRQFKDLGNGTKMSKHHLHEFLGEASKLKSQGFEIGGDLGKEVDRFTRTQEVWQKLIDMILEARKAREAANDKYGKDTEEAESKIRSISADTAAILIELSGQVKEARKADIDADLMKDIDALKHKSLNYWTYVNYVVALTKYAEAQKDLIDKKASEARKASIDKIMAKQQEQVDRGLALQERYDGLIRAKMGESSAKKISALNLEMMKLEALNQKHLNKNLVDIMNNSNLIIAEKMFLAAREKAIAEGNSELIEKIRKEEFRIIQIEGRKAYLDFAFAVYDAFKTVQQATVGIEDNTEAILKGAKAGYEAGKAFGVWGQIMGTVIGALQGLWNAGNAQAAARNKERAEVAALTRELAELAGSYLLLIDYTAGLGLETLRYGTSLAQTEAFAKEFKERLEEVKNEMEEISSVTAGLITLNSPALSYFKALGKDAIFAVQSIDKVSDAFIRFRDAVPLNSDVQAFVLGQVQSAANNVGGMLAAMQTIADRRAQAEETARRLAANGGEPLDQKAFDEIAMIQGQIKLTSTGALAMASILIASFDGSTRSLREMATSVGLLRQAMLDNGITASASFEGLSRLVGIATSEITGPMVDAIDFATAALTNMYNSGFLTQEVFSGMVDEIMAQRQALLDSGVAMEDVDRIMQPSLQRIWELMRDGKLEVDDTTRALIEQGLAAGTIGPTFMSATDRMVEALEKLARMFETVFAEKLVDAARRGAEGAQREVDGIRVPNFRQRGPEGHGGPGLPGFATGTRGQFLDFGSGTDVTLHGRERIMTEGESANISGGDQTIILELDGEVILRKVVRGMPRHLKLIGAQ